MIGYISRGFEWSVDKMQILPKRYPETKGHCHDNHILASIGL